jgi:outer membrane protein assembly factor BamB
VEPLLPDDPARIGPNELLARLGAGGMGQVYLARTRGGRPVAVKVIHDDLAADRDFRARFGREVAAARRVTGAFTAPLLDADPDAPVPWLATAYLPGLSLADAVAGHGPLPVPAARALGAALAEALVAVHRADIVHRDLKPPNVLLTSAGPRVIDFGIARAADFATLTRTGVIIGTPGYLAPEQITGADAGPPVDVFALGALLVHALTGVGPFGRGSSHELLQRSVGAEPALGAIADPALRAQLAACLAKDPDRRPAPAELVAAWSSAGADLDGTRWLPDPLAAEIDRAATALPRLTAAPWRTAPAHPVGAPAGADATATWPPPAPTPPRARRGLSRRALLGGALGVGALGAVGAVLLRTGVIGPTSDPVRWLLPADQYSLSDSPLVLDGVVLGQNPSGLLESRDPADGSRRWTSNVEITLSAALTGIDGVCVGFPGGFGDGVVGIDLATGDRLWQQQPLEPGSTYAAIPVAAGGRALLAGREERGSAAVHALGLRDGTPLWRTEVSGILAYGVAVDGDLAYTADQDGYAYAIDTASGVVQWRVRVTEQGEGAYSRPVATGGRVYLADRDVLHALDGRTGRPVWDRAIDDGVAESTRPVVVDDRVYLRAVGGTLYALGAADGTVAWTAEGAAGRPVLAGQVALVCSEDALAGLALDSGRPLWSRPIGSDYEMWPVLAGGLVHLADDSGVVSLEPAGGRVVRTVGEADGVSGAHQLDTDGSALYLSVWNSGPALCSLTLPQPPG